MCAANSCLADYLQPEVHRQLDDQANEVKRMLNSFIRALG